MWGNEALPEQSSGKLTSLPLANLANTTHRAKRRQARAERKPRHCGRHLARPNAFPPKEKGTFRCPFSSGRRGQFRLRASAKGWWRRSIARAKLWQANEFAFDKLGQYRAESDHKAERDPRTQASRACPFAEKEEQGNERMASFSPKAKKKPEQSGLCSDVVPLTGVEPVRHCCLGILSPVCLPISPQRLTNTLLYSQSPPKSRKSAAAAWAKKSSPSGPPSPPGSPG